MHKSGLAGFIIDCQTEALDEAANFWSQALGFPARTPGTPEEEQYRLLETGPDEAHIEVQRVSHASRVHLDIETDDIDAEVARLEKLGAKTVKKVRTWWVMEAPTGHRFCVVRPSRKDFESRANQWD